MVTGAGFTGAGKRELKKGGFSHPFRRSGKAKPPPDKVQSLRPDALTPTLSYREREKDYSFGPALTSASPAGVSVYFSKFSINSFASDSAFSRHCSGEP